MTEIAKIGSEPASKTPVWWWIAAVIAVLWNGMGVVDFVMTLTRNQGYMASFTPEQRRYFFSFPAWYVAIWAAAVFAAFVASLALVIRTRFAAPLFSMSLILFVANTIYVYGFTEAWAMMGAFGAAFSVIIFLSLVLLWLMARVGNARSWTR